MHQPHRPYQKKTIALAVAQACHIIGHEHNLKKALADVESEKLTSTGRLNNTMPEFQEFPK